MPISAVNGTHATCKIAINRTYANVIFTDDDTAYPQAFPESYWPTGNGWHC